MKSLYEEVLKGKYQRIPSFYSLDPANAINSLDLAQTVKRLLNVRPELRPSCSSSANTVGEILSSPAITRRLGKHFPELREDKVLSSALLKTIEVPEDLSLLSSRLPRPSYNPLPKKCETARVLGPSKECKREEQKCIQKNHVPEKSKGHEHKSPRVSPALKMAQQGKKPSNPNPADNRKRVQDLESDKDTITKHSVPESPHTDKEHGEVQTPQQLREKRAEEVEGEPCGEEVYRNDPHIQRIANKKKELDAKKNRKAVEMRLKKMVENRAVKQNKAVKLPKVVYTLTHS